MFSIRNLTRSLPRCSSRLSSSSLARRTIAPLHKPSQLPRNWSIAPIACRAAFSTGLPRFEDQTGLVDSELSSKLASELQLEAEATNVTDGLPPNLKEYLDTSPWELQDTPGEEEVVLKRTFGKEKIKVSFTVADLNYGEDTENFSEDPAMYDEEDSSMQQGGAQSKGTINQGRTKGGNINVAPEDKIAPADREELADDESADGTGIGPMWPAHLHITIEKDGIAGALQIEAVVRDGEIQTENFHFFAAKALADVKTAEAEWSRRNMYTGPAFTNLDEELQVYIDKYIAERGIDTALAVWVPDYVDYKEQKEYVNWLGQVKEFVDA